MPSKKGKKRQVMAPTGPHKRREPPPPAPCPAPPTTTAPEDESEDESEDPLQEAERYLKSLDDLVRFLDFFRGIEGVSRGEIYRPITTHITRIRQLFGLPVSEHDIRTADEVEREARPPTSEAISQTDPPPTSSTSATQTPTLFFRETRTADSQVQTEEPEVPKRAPAPAPPQKPSPPPMNKSPEDIPGKKPPPPLGRKPPLSPPTNKHSAPPPPPRKEAPPPPHAAPASRAIVLHAAPTKFKAGQMRRWVEEDNRGIKIAGIRWLLREGHRLGKAASSLVIYLATPLEAGYLRMGHKLFRTTEYDWDRPTVDKGKGR